MNDNNDNINNNNDNKKKNNNVVDFVYAGLWKSFRGDQSNKSVNDDADQLT